MPRHGTGKSRPRSLRAAFQPAQSQQTGTPAPGSGASNPLGDASVAGAAAAAAAALARELMSPSKKYPELSSDRLLVTDGVPLALSARRPLSPGTVVLARESSSGYFRLAAVIQPESRGVLMVQFVVPPYAIATIRRVDVIVSSSVDHLLGASLNPGQLVMARAADGFVYTGRIQSRLSPSLYRVDFDDGELRKPIARADIVVDGEPTIGTWRLQPGQVVGAMWPPVAGQTLMDGLSTVPPLDEHVHYVLKVVDAAQTAALADAMHDDVVNEGLSCGPAKFTGHHADTNGSSDPGTTELPSSHRQLWASRLASTATSGDKVSTVPIASLGVGRTHTLPSAAATHGVSGDSALAAATVAAESRSDRADSASAPVLTTGHVMTDVATATPDTTLTTIEADRSATASGREGYVAPGVSAAFAPVEPMEATPSVPVVTSEVAAGRSLESVEDSPSRWVLDAISSNANGLHMLTPHPLSSSSPSKHASPHNNKVDSAGKGVAASLLPAETPQSRTNIAGGSHVAGAAMRAELTPSLLSSSSSSSLPLVDMLLRMYHVAVVINEHRGQYLVEYADGSRRLLSSWCLTLSRRYWI